jgi:hypothetical protein
LRKAASFSADIKRMGAFVSAANEFATNSPLISTIPKQARIIVALQ